MTDLLPCPFCGGAAVDRREIDGFSMIYCNGDECFRAYPVDTQD